MVGNRKPSSPKTRPYFTDVNVYFAKNVGTIDSLFNPTTSETICRIVAMSHHYFDFFKVEYLKRNNIIRSDDSCEMWPIKFLLFLCQNRFPS